MKKSEEKGEAEGRERSVLVGTYRPENAAWIREKRLYNLSIAAGAGAGPLGERDARPYCLQD